MPTQACLSANVLRASWLCYGSILFVAVACLRQKTVHLQHIGIEVAAFGCLLTYLDPLRFVRNRAAPAVPETEGA